MCIYVKAHVSTQSHTAASDSQWLPIKALILKEQQEIDMSREAVTMVLALAWFGELSFLAMLLAVMGSAAKAFQFLFVLYASIK